MPAQDHGQCSILAPNVGCTQAVLEPNSDVLFPVRYQRHAEKRVYASIVARCSFDDGIFTYLEHGFEHTIVQRRGLYEPSLARFDPIREWHFDDDEILGSYNMQQRG
ncbi:MAG: hypothetical protein M2R45_03215 [Verrucomicrobia subdivision 3 bacterium]|nr:hypothetical protein [Limisphaerales bacterium]MCS1413930.1 hypothetical protein [Limisphaerales bacterium]